MNVIHTLRTYLGLSQADLAHRAGITQPDLSEMESKPPYGYPAKYQRLAAALGVPVDPILKNEFATVPLSFFDLHPAPEYTPTPVKRDHLLGRQGEEFVFRREQARLETRYPALARLVLPYFKMKCPSPGYDILSFDDAGQPVMLEVKTSVLDNDCFYLTNNELTQATALTKEGERYFIVCISGWGTEKQKVCDIPYPALSETHVIQPWKYICRPIAKKADRNSISGLAYFRRARCLKQAELAERLGIAPCDLSLYENRVMTPSVGVFLRLSELLDATVDELLAEYDTASGKAVG